MGRLPGMLDVLSLLFMLAVGGIMVAYVLTCWLRGEKAELLDPKSNPARWRDHR